MHPPAWPAETVVNASLNRGSTLAVNPEHATLSSIASNARAVQESTVRTAPTSSTGASSSEQDASHLRSRNTLRVTGDVIEETVVEKDREESECNKTLVDNGASSCNNSWLDFRVTDDNNLVPYSTSDSNTNASALHNNSEKCARLNPDQDPPPWFTHYGEDIYDHVTRGLIYIETSVPGPGLDMNTFQQMPQGCNCRDDCCSRGNDRKASLFSKADARVNRPNKASDMSEFVHIINKDQVNRDCCLAEGPEKLKILSSDIESVAQKSRCNQDVAPVSCGCSCSDRTPASYLNGLLVQPNLPWPIYECNDDCHCPSASSPRPSSGCQNRVVQRGPRRDLVIRQAIRNTKECMTKCGDESPVVCDSQWSKGNGRCDVQIDSHKNLCKRQFFSSDDPEEIKRLSHPLTSCLSAANDPLSFIDQVHQNDTHAVSAPESVTRRSKRLPDKGLGVFTKFFIPRGSFICEYAGELLGEEEAKRRFAKQEREGKSNYILVLREFYGEDVVAPSVALTGTMTESPKYSSPNDSFKYSQRDATGEYCNKIIPIRRRSQNSPTNEISTKQDSDFLEEGRKQDILKLSSLKPAQVTIIDPMSIGNIGRYLNHSCDPNTHVVPVRINSVIPVAAVFAVRDVQPGEELVYDYGSVREAAPLCLANRQPTNAADRGTDTSDGDVDGMGDENNYVGDCCNFGSECTKLNGSQLRVSLEKRGANAAQSPRGNSLDVGEVAVGVQKRRTLQNFPCDGQHRSTEKKQKLGSALFSECVEVQPTGSRTDKLEWVNPMAIVDFDVTRKIRCLCGAQNCRGYLPAEVDLF